MHTSRSLDTAVGASIFLKCESFQRAGAFKFRGAYNAISLLPESARRPGVVAYSSGNHAQAVALAASLLNTRATVVMPVDAPRVKRDATAGYGAEIILYDPSRERREEVAAELVGSRGAALIPPFDHPHVIAGQGTAALELFEDVPGLDLLLVPCGGGGLLSGSALAAGAASGCDVAGIEPEGADDAVRSFRTGVLHRSDHPATIADGLRTPSLGEYTWPIVRTLVADMRTVSDDEIIEGMRYLWTHLKLVVEPSGATAFAALFRYPEMVQGKRIGVILSGGNVDLETVLPLMAG